MAQRQTYSEEEKKVNYIKVRLLVQVKIVLIREWLVHGCVHVYMLYTYICVCTYTYTHIQNEVDTNSKRNER